MTPLHCYVVRMDVQADREALFNEVYDREHIPEISKVEGVRRVTRFRTSSPHEPRYMAIYEIARPELPFSPEWKAASDTGRWAPEVRPYTTNRDNNRAVCTRMGGAPQLTYGTPHVLLEALDVDASKESFLDEVYERERLPALSRVPGVRNSVRFRADGPGHPRHVALHEIDSPAVPTSEAFVAADRSGRWSSHVLPAAFNRHVAVYDRIGP